MHALYAGNDAMLPACVLATGITGKIYRDGASTTSKSPGNILDISERCSKTLRCIQTGWTQSRGQCPLCKQGIGPRRPSRQCIGQHSSSRGADL